ncbi:sensor domain-containing diguanylate cyclase [Pleionea litopenaei]|uniref:Diguanylate cyclase n=1 Tax=Pleionea litopenaei TaxID=3070815 RepID=A0AA51RQK2_9GAMM|nr:diguanylate cyclase [Pleionea sp. HL-JVS1]WMS85715.1 diguanylate cyclase [Pleionea sp. HL-JVS1]
MKLPDQIFKQAADNALDVIMITAVDFDDPGNNTIVYVNDAFVELFGYSKQEIIGQSPRVLQGPNTDPATRDKIRAALTQGLPVTSEIINYGKHGQEFWIDLKMVPLFNSDNEITHFLFIERDLSSRKNREQQLYQEATIDGLTQIYNRQHTYQLAAKAIEKASRYKSPLCALLLDIDHFKQVNDNFGHVVGDKVLKKLAQLITQEVRSSDIFGRVGGEEFFILLPEVPLEQAQVFAERVRARVHAATWEEAGLSTALSISVGVAEFDNDHLESLISKADHALYQAKNLGRNRVESFKEAK